MRRVSFQRCVVSVCFGRDVLAISIPWARSACAKDGALEQAIDVVPQSADGHRMDVQVHVFRIADAFEKEPQIAPSLEGEEGLVDARAEGPQEQQVEDLDGLMAIPHRVILRVIDTYVD